MCVNSDQYFLLKCAGFHPKFPVSEKVPWEPGSRVPEENRALMIGKPTVYCAAMQDISVCFVNKVRVRDTFQLLM